MRWIENDLGLALAQGERAGKMILVWWTAGWCPPCNELKLTVFDQARFIERSEELVLLMIDGDARGAQAVGERLRVRSYPSTVLLDSRGSERLRFPGGLTVAEFCRVLDLAMAHPIGIAEIAARLAKGEILSDVEHELTGYHWWAIDDVHAIGVERLALLRKAFQGCPAHLEAVRLRLLVQLLGAASKEGVESADEESGTLSMRAFLQLALQSPVACFSNLYLLLVDLVGLDCLAANRTPEREELDRALHDTIERMLIAQDLTWTERLIALMAIMNLEANMHAREMPDAAMRKRVKIAAMQADQASFTVAERQTAINMAGHLLKAAGLRDEAQKMFSSEAQRSPHRGYFMTYLAQMSLEEGRKEEAIDWFREAYESTPLGASRFSRGVRYIGKLIELMPGERALVARELTDVLAEIGADPAPLAGINRSSMESLLASLAPFVGNRTGD